MKKNLSFLLLTIVLLFGHSLVMDCSLLFGNGDDNEYPRDVDKYVDPEPPEDVESWSYATVEYLHDLLSPDLYFMKIVIHPDNPEAKAIDGFMSHDGHAIVRLRGLDVPRSMHHVSQRHRPPHWRERERGDWNEAINYVWKITSPTHTFRLHNLRIVELNNPMLTVAEVLEADMQFFGGGNWHNLAISMLADEHARPLQADGSRWDAGSKKYSLENPNLPR